MNTFGEAGRFVGRIVVPSMLRRAVAAGKPKRSHHSGIGAFVLSVFQKLAPFDPSRIVHREKLYGRASNHSHTFNNRSSETKMICPMVASRIEQRNNVARCRVDTGKVRSFPQIAAVTGEGEIAVIVASLVLAGNYMLDVMRERTTILWEQAILATVSGSRSDKQARCQIHCYAASDSRFRAFNFRIATKSSALMSR
jgi:hypothetical protein